jgi:hypothetical protein
MSWMLRSMFSRPLMYVHRNFATVSCNNNTPGSGKLTTVVPRESG